ALAITERYAYRRADALVSLLPAARHHMVTRGLAPEKFNVIPNGAPETAQSDAKIDPSIARWIKQCRSAGRRIIAYAGAFGRPNAMISFSDIYDCLKRDPGLASKVAFLFVGDGAERPMLETVLGERAGKGPAAPFIFAGQVTREVAAELLRRCDAGL